VFSITENLFEEGDLCREEIDSYFQKYPVQLIPFCVLNKFHLNMVFVRRGINFIAT
jgi:hypothetical protein